MIIESLAIFIGLEAHLFAGSTFVLKDKDITIRQTNKYLLGDYNTKALGFKPLSGEYITEVSYKVAENQERLSKIYLGWEHKCFHKIDQVPTLENLDYGVSNKFFIQEVK